jgi:drug/metabolite transporter (DMT)-like permease
VWEFNWGVFWAILAALAICAFASRLRKHLDPEAMAGNFILAFVGAVLVLFIVVGIGLVFFPHFRETFVNWHPFR